MSARQKFLTLLTETLRCRILPAPRTVLSRRRKVSPKVRFIRSPRRRRVRPCDIGGVVAGEECHCCGDFLRFAEALRWNLLQQGLAEFLGMGRSKLAEKRRLDHARSHGVDWEVSADQLKRQAAGRSCPVPPRLPHSALIGARWDGGQSDGRAVLLAPDGLEVPLSQFTSSSCEGVASIAPCQNANAASQRAHMRDGNCGSNPGLQSRRRARLLPPGTGYGRSSLPPHPNLEGIIRPFANLPPLIAVVAKCRHAVEKLLESRVRLRDLGIGLIRCFVCGF